MLSLMPFPDPEALPLALALNLDPLQMGPTILDPDRTHQRMSKSKSQPPRTAWEAAQKVIKETPHPAQPTTLCRPLDKHQPTVWGRVQSWRTRVRIPLALERM